MASPELRPGAGCAQMFIDEKPLKRSRRGEPLAQRREAKEEKGTILPSLARTWIFSRSAGPLRKGASDWTKTRFTRAFLTKLFT